MQLFVFPLSNMVFFPFTSKPLNIFEPRYLQMVEDSLRLEIPIALAFVESPQSTHAYSPGQPLDFVRSIAGFGMPTIVERRSDGTLLIFLRAIGKVSLGALRQSETPYLIVDAEEIPEDNELPSRQISQLMTLQKILSSWVQKNITEEEIRLQFFDQLRKPEEIIGCCGAFLVTDPDLQQSLLEENSLDKKINFLMGILASGH